MFDKVTALTESRHVNVFTTMAKRVSIVLYVCAWRSMDVKAIARQILWKSHGTELILMIFQSKAPYHSTILQKMERLQKLHAWSIWNIGWKSAEHHQVNIFWGIISILSKITTTNSKHRKKRVLFILKIFHSAKCNTAKWKHLHRHVYWDSTLVGTHEIWAIEKKNTQQGKSGP